MRMGINVSILGCLMFAVACGDGSSSKVTSGSTAGSSDFSQSAVLVSKKIDDFKHLSPGGEKSHISALMSSSWWTDTSLNLPDERTDPQGVLNGREYVSVQLDPEAEQENSASINVFGRMGTVLMINCAIGEVLPASSFQGNYPKDGTHHMSFSAANVEKITKVCNDKDVEVGMQITMSVESVTSANYDKKIRICFGKLEECTGSDIEQTYFYKSTSNVLNIVTSEDSGQDPQNPTHVARTTLSLDKVNDTLRAEYFSGPVDLGTHRHGKIHRLLRQGSEAMIITSFWDNNSGSAEQMAYVIKGNLDDLNSEVSIEIANGNATGSGCFNRQTGALNASCTLDTSVNLGNVQAMVEDLFTNGYNAEDYRGSINSTFSFTGFNNATSAPMSKN